MAWRHSTFESCRIKRRNQGIVDARTDCIGHVIVNLPLCFPRIRSPPRKFAGSLRCVKRIHLPRLHISNENGACLLRFCQISQLGHRLSPSSRRNQMTVTLQTQTTQAVERMHFSGWLK